MEAIYTFLNALQNRIFKLLPMREAYDKGEDNCLNEYIDNLYLNIVGAFVTFGELSSHKAIVEVCNNIAFLKDNIDIPLKKWRSIVLHSVNLLSNLIANRQEV